MATTARFGRFLPLLLPALALAVVAGGKLGLLTYGSSGQRTTLRPEWLAADTSEYLFVFIGSSRCAVSRGSELRQAVLQARDALTRRAARDGVRLVTLGVAVDANADVGLSFLRLFGAWDEVSAGRAWLNHAVVRYVLRDIPGEVAVPQIVLLRRHVQFVSEQLRVGDDQLVTRKVGLGEIETWLKGGVGATGEGVLGHANPL